VGSFVVEQPLVLGHEAAGTIVGVGEGVDPSRIGERVSIEPQRPDPDSKETRRGHYNLCPHMRFYATPPVDGALCDYVTIGAGYAHRVPDSVSDDAAALCEPLSVGIAAVRKAGLDGGSRVLITGAGPIGIVLAQLARAYGATDIIVSDPDESRRKQALTFGATAVLDPTVQPIGELSVDGGARRLGRRVDGVADAADPEPGAGTHRGVPVRQHVADGDRARRVRAG
jgi:L-iditol 2-dehydrogenase